MDNKNPHNRVGSAFIQLGPIATSKGFILRNCPDHYELENIKEKLIHRFHSLDDIRTFLDKQEG